MQWSVYLDSARRNQANNMIIIIVTALLYFSSFANGLETEDCGSVSGSYSRVAISGCSKKNNKCILHRGSDTNIEIDFVPDRDVSELNIVMYALLGWIPMPLPYPRPDPCVDPDSGIQCPLVKGKRYRYKATIPASRNYPLKSIRVKWELQDQSGEDIVCTIIPVHIRQ